MGGTEHRRGTCTVGSRGEESRRALEPQKGVRAPALESEWACGPEFRLTVRGRFCGGPAARRAERGGSACVSTPHARGAGTRRARHVSCRQRGRLSLEIVEGAAD